MELLIPDNSKLHACSAFGVCFSSSVVVHSHTKIGYNILVVTLWKLGCQFSVPEGNDVTVASE